MIIRVYRAIDWSSYISRTRIMAQKPHSPPKSENCRKSMSLPLAACADCDNSPREYDKEPFEPSKDSWSLVVYTEKKLLRFGFGVFGGCRQREGRFCFSLVFLLWRHLTDNEPKLWLKLWLDSRLEYESLEPLMDFLAFLVPKLWPEDPNLLRNMLSNLRGFP